MTERPAYVDLLPPCNFTCPAGENIQAWMTAAGAGDYRAAWLSLVQDNPLPAITGRVCYHPCESSCNRSGFDEALNIHAVERFLGDEALRAGWQFEPPPPPTGKRVLIAGSGPAGLSAAYQLRRFGHDVIVHEASPKPGGMLRYGIPRYRLPRNILDAEIQRIEGIGVTFALSSRVDDLTKAAACFDAVFLAIGAQITKRTQLHSGDAAKLLDALTFLRDVESGVTPRIGRRVLVYGGGNSALDVARTAKRLGASETLIIYRRTREKMPAQDFEVDEALQEGIAFKWLSTIEAVGEESVTLEKMRLDDNGYPQPTGEYETIAGGAVILALGQDVDRALLQELDGAVDEHMMTARSGVFAGGDMVPGDRTVTTAIGHGKKAARNIDAYVRGQVYGAAPKHAMATFDRLNTSHFEHAVRVGQPALDAAQRQAAFDEVIGALDEAGARAEARRCLSCGNCHECDNCYEVCPGDAVLKLGPRGRYKFNYENCDGCGLCAEECPCGAIEMLN